MELGDRTGVNEFTGMAVVLESLVLIKGVKI
jgi:hypothetical protein